MATERDARGKVASTTRNARTKVGAGQARYRVTDGTQVHHEGRVHAEGEELVVDKAAALAWVGRGYVEEVSK